MNEQCNFRDCGFLGDENKEYSESFRAKYQTWLKLYEDIVELCYSVAMTRKGHTTQAHFLGHSFFARGITNFQSVFLLAERGLDAECKAVLRSFAEVAFALVAIARDTSFASKILRNNEYQEWAWFKKWNDLSNGKDPQIVATLANHASVTGQDKLDIKEVAEAAEMMGFYKAHYSRLCMFGHPTPHSLALRIRRNQEQGSIGIDFFPTDTEADDNLRIGCILIFFCMRAYSTLFDCLTGEVYLPLERRFEAICEGFDIKELRNPKV